MVNVEYQTRESQEATLAWIQHKRDEENAKRDAALRAQRLSESRIDALNQFENLVHHPERITDKKSLEAARNDIRSAIHWLQSTSEGVDVSKTIAKLESELHDVEQKLQGVNDQIPEFTFFRELQDRVDQMMGAQYSNPELDQEITQLRNRMQQLESRLAEAQAANKRDRVRRLERQIRDNSQRLQDKLHIYDLEESVHQRTSTPLAEPEAAPRPAPEHEEYIPPEPQVEEEKIPPITYPEPAGTVPSPPSETPPPDQEVIASSENGDTLTGWFNQVEGDYPQYNPLFIENPPNSLTPEQLSIIFNTPEIVTDKQYFIRNQFGEYVPNPELIPWTWFESESSDRRFWNAARVTGNDLRLFGVVAVSARDAAEQAILYRDIAQSMLLLYQYNPDLLSRSFYTHSEVTLEMPDGGISSLDVFAHRDSIRVQQAGTEGIANEQLLAYGQNGTIDLPATNQLWTSRITELQYLLSNPNAELKPYHLEWIEFLAQSFDITELMNVLSQFQPHVEGNPQQPQTENVIVPEEPQFPPELQPEVQTLADKQRAMVEAEMAYLTAQQKGRGRFLRNPFNRKPVVDVTLRQNMDQSTQDYLKTRNNLMSQYGIYEIRNYTGEHTPEVLQAYITNRLSEISTQFDRALSEEEITQLKKNPTIQFRRCWTDHPKTMAALFNIASIGIGLAMPFVGIPYWTPLGWAFDAGRVVISAIGYEPVVHTWEPNAKTRWNKKTIQEKAISVKAEDAAHIYIDRLGRKMPQMTSTEEQLLQSYYTDRITQELLRRRISEESTDEDIQLAINTSLSRYGMDYTPLAGTEYDIDRQRLLLNPDPNKGWRFVEAGSLGALTMVPVNLVGVPLYNFWNTTVTPWLNNIFSSMQTEPLPSGITSTHGPMIVSSSESPHQPVTMIAPLAFPQKVENNADFTGMPTNLPSATQEYQGYDLGHATYSLNYLREKRTVSNISGVERYNLESEEPDIMLEAA